MSLLTYYLIFCLATGITTCITSVNQALVAVYKIDPGNLMVKYQIATYISMLVLTGICAPLVFPMLFFFSKSHEFRDGLIKSFLD